MGSNRFFNMADKGTETESVSSNVVEKDAVVYVGYPGQDTELKENRLVIGVSGFAGNVKSTRSSDFSIDTDWDFYESYKNEGQKKEDFRPGGLSGAPIFTIKKPLRFIGVLNEGPIQEIPIVKCTHASFIDEYGNINDLL